MPDGPLPLTLTLHPRIAEIAPADWNACAGADNPFVSHAFLSALEDSGSAGPRTGWLPQINTGMAGRIAGTGQVGAGLVQPPQECFEKALAALAEGARAA